MYKGTKGINRDDLFLTVKNMQDSSGHSSTSVVFHLELLSNLHGFFPLYLKIKKKKLKILLGNKGSSSESSVPVYSFTFSLSVACIRVDFCSLNPDTEVWSVAFWKVGRKNALWIRVSILLNVS